MESEKSIDNHNQMAPKTKERSIWIISQYASTPQTGRGGRPFYMAKELGKRGINTYLIAASYTHLLRRLPEVRGDVEIENHETMKMVWIKMPKYGNSHSKKRIWNWIAFALKLGKLQKRLPDKPDVIMYSSPGLIGFLGAERLARKLNAKLVFEVRDIWPLTLCELGGYSEKNLFIRFLQWIEDRAYAKSDVVISNLKNAIEHMKARGLDENKFYWIPNGISREELSVSEKVGDDILKRVTGTRFLVGYTGAVGLANNVDNLIRAAEILRDKKEIGFVIVGGGNQKKALIEYTNEKNLNNVTFLDPVPKNQIQDLLENFSALYIGLKKNPVFKYGVSPNKLFDYFYAGKPVLYAIDSGDYHPVADAEAGIELPPDNPEALAGGILDLFHSTEADREAMGKNAHQSVLRDYEYGNLANSLKDILFTDHEA